MLVDYTSEFDAPRSKVREINNFDWLEDMRRYDAYIIETLGTYLELLGAQPPGTSSTAKYTSECPTPVLEDT